MQPDQIQNTWVIDELPGLQDSLESAERSDDSRSDDDCVSWVDLTFDEDNSEDDQSGKRLDLGRRQKKDLIPRRAGRNSGRIGKRINLTNLTPARKSSYAFQKWQSRQKSWTNEKAFGTFKCQVCLSKWSSSLAWAQKNESGRVGYKYGQICKSAGCEGAGHRIFVRPHELLFYLDPDDRERLQNKGPRKGATLGDHIKENCEMCIRLGDGKSCFQMERSRRWRQANHASAAYSYKNEPVSDE